MRNVMLVLALVLAFQAGRLMPARTTWSTQSMTATAYAQAPPGSELDAFADQVAYETLIQLEARAPAISEALRLELSELTGLIQQRLGPEVETLHGQVLTAQSVMARSQAVLDRADNTINRSEDVIDDTKDTLDDTEDTLDDTEDTLDDTEDTLDDTERLLAETKQTLQRSKDLLRETEQATADAQELARKLAEDIEDMRSILDRLPVGP
jgi:ParB family chromosome partitioning protein